MRPAAFLDRDGAIIVDKNYLSDPDGVKLLPGAVEGLRLLQAAGYLLIIVTNQSGIGRGMFSAQDAEAVNERLSHILESRGVHITATYYCPHAPTDNCDCRKPNPGMFVQAAREHGIDLPKSVTIGDKESDVMAGQAAGCRLSILLAPDDGQNDVLTAPDLEAAAHVVLEQAGANA